MRVLVAGAAGAIGRPLVPQLLDAGHEVHATTRKPTRATELSAAGAVSEVVDFLEPGAADALLERVRPDVVIDELTSLPHDYDPRKAESAYVHNNRIRSEGTGALLAAAEKHGVQRYILQSVAFIYAPGSSGLRSETDPVWSDAPDPFADAIATLVENERIVAESSAFTGVTLRYGFLYGPGTWYESGGSTTVAIQKRRLPLIGGGTGVNSLVHVGDAVAATVCATVYGKGIYNVVDDDPASFSELVPELARILGAKQPMRIPRWLGRIIAGGYLVEAATRMPGASNAKAKAELGWAPILPSWREGMRDFRDSYPSGSQH